MQVLLIGPPGSGKGTQAKLLQERLDLPHISSGDLLRGAVKRKTSAGLEAKRYMDRGELVPDAIVVRAMEERVRRDDCERGFIVDGFPRTVAQADVLNQMLEPMHKSIDHVVSFLVTRDELIKRLSGRRTCRDCGTMYHIIFDPPVNAGLCNKCNGELYQRDDDQEDTIVARLDVYERQTAPLLSYYQARDLLRAIDGLGSPAQVFDRILKVLPPQ